LPNNAGGKRSVCDFLAGLQFLSVCGGRAPACQQGGNHPHFLRGLLTIFKNRIVQSSADEFSKGDVMSGNAVLENVRRYRAIASLYRQTAAFRPLQKWSLLDQAEEWERRAMRELEAHFNMWEGAAEPNAAAPAHFRMLAAA
jgi:hypothetical protein